MPDELASLVVRPLLQFKHQAKAMSSPLEIHKVGNEWQKAFTWVETSVLYHPHVSRAKHARLDQK